MKEQVTARQRYESLRQLREGPLQRARDAAELTIPGLIPPEGHDGSTPFKKPFQSVGARGVNHLSGKFLMALFPTTSSFFKMELDAKVEDEAEGQPDAAQLLGETKKGLAKIEKRVSKRIEQNGSRAPLYETFRHLIVAGNMLIQIMDRGSIRCYPMHQYVVKRDGEGNVLDTVIMEKYSLTSLPERARQVVEGIQTVNPEINKENRDKSGENNYELYTRIMRMPDEWVVYQEILDQEIPDTRGTYPLDKSPWIAARFSRIDGEDWGRGLVEEYIGDLMSLEGLAQSTVEMAAQLARILYFVEPGGMTTPDEVAKALNGDVLEGRATDVTVLQIQKIAEFRAAFEKEQSIERRLEQAFLLLTAVQRDAERVTAAEVQMVAQELEQSFGGVYSLFAEEIQLPLAKCVMLQMQKEGSLPQFPAKAVNPQIVTGSAALGRNGDFQKLVQLASTINSLFGPEAAQEWLDVGMVIKQLAVAIGIDVDEAVKTVQQVMQARQAQAAQETLQKIGPEMIKANAAGQPEAAPQAA